MAFEFALDPQVTTVLTAFLTAFITVLLGYLRDNDPEKSFEPAKLVTTLIIGGIMGFLTAFMGWTYADAQTWFAQAGLTVWVYWIAKIIVNRFKKSP